MKIEIPDIGLCEFDFTKMHVVGGKTIINDGTVRYKWINGDKSNALKGISTQISTRCESCVPEQINFFSIAHQNPVDKYSKLTGKKVALTRVLELLWPTKEDNDVSPTETEILHKSYRHLVWVGFWKEFRHLL